MNNNQIEKLRIVTKLVKERQLTQEEIKHHLLTEFKTDNLTMLNIRDLDKLINQLNG